MFLKMIIFDQVFFFQNVRIFANQLQAIEEKIESLWWLEYCSG